MRNVVCNGPVEFQRSGLRNVHSVGVDGRKLDPVDGSAFAVLKNPHCISQSLSKKNKIKNKEEKREIKK